MTYAQAYNSSDNSTRIEIFESAFGYLSEVPEFASMSVKQIELWCQEAPYDLLAWSVKRWIRETKAMYVQRVESYVADQVNYLFFIN